MSTSSSSGPASTIESGSSTPRTEPDFDSCSLLKLNSPHKVDEKYILVTGGLGYIGSHTVLELLKDGYNVVIIDDLSNSYFCVLNRIKSLVDLHYSQQPEPKTIPSLDFFKIDYGNVPAVRSVLDRYVLSHPASSDPFLPLVSSIVGVVHFASFKSPAESIGEPLAYYRNNVASFISFIETLDSYGIKTFIFSSSAAVYGTSLYEDGTIGEESCAHIGETCGIDALQGKFVQYGCTDLTSPYARSKWMCEAILSDISVSDPEWRIVALRYFNPIGCDSSGLLGEDPLGIPNNLMPLICKALRGDISHLNVFGTDYDTKDGTGVRDFIHVTDLAVAHIAALNAARSGTLRTRFRTFNVGSGQGSSVLELVEAMSLVSGKKIPLRFTTRRDGDVAMSVAKPHRAEEELDWKTHRSLLDSCRDTLNFLSKNSMGYPTEAYTH